MAKEPPRLERNRPNWLLPLGGGLDPRFLNLKKSLNQHQVLGDFQYQIRSSNCKRVESVDMRVSECVEMRDTMSKFAFLLLWSWLLVNVSEVLTQ